VTRCLHLRLDNLSQHTERVDFLIRDYRATDFDVLWKIDQICFPPGIAYTQMDLTGFVTRRKAITRVAEFAPASEFAGGIAGFAVAQPIRNIGRILTLDILPEARRFGLGSRLLRDCEARLHAAGCRQSFLETAVDNEAALGLYRKLGYEVIRTLPLYYSMHALDAYLMGKVLCPS
jgi:[ribosomal protein S18]-alanine N-acetyltransferase